jgi:hypothetical protein
MMLTPPGYRRGISRPQAAFDLDRRSRFVNQQVDSCRERLLQIQPVAHNRHQHAILVQLGVAHRAQKFRQIVDLRQSTTITSNSWAWIMARAAAEVLTILGVTCN